MFSLDRQTWLSQNVRVSIRCALHKNLTQVEINDKSLGGGSWEVRTVHTTHETASVLGLPIMDLASCTLVEPLLHATYQSMVATGSRPALPDISN